MLEGKFDSFDKIVFMGDYSDDSWVTFSDDEIIDNLNEVIEFKKNHNDNVELLVGNHDFQYIVGYPTASRYRKSYAKEMHKIFNDNADIFKIIHIENDHIFTHAGITNGWIDYIKSKYKIKDIHSFLFKFEKSCNKKYILTIYHLSKRKRHLNISFPFYLIS